MAPNIPTEPINTATPAPAGPPALVDRVRSILPRHAFVQVPAPTMGARTGSFAAWFTTPSGRWRIRYNGKASPLVQALSVSAARGNPRPAEADIEVSGPDGQWTFPPHTSASRLAEFLESVGAVAPVAPPAPTGFAYIGTVDQDGLSFGVDRSGGVTVGFDAARAAAGAPKTEAAADNVDGQAQKDLDDLRVRTAAEADQLRSEVATAEERLYWDQAGLDKLRMKARAAERAAGCLGAFHAESVLASVVGGPSCQRLVPLHAAARIAADMVEEATR